MINILKIDMYV